MIQETNVANIDEDALRFACDHAEVSMGVLRELIKRINVTYSETKQSRGESKRKLHDIWIDELSLDTRIDLLNQRDYKTALGAYYSKRRTSKKVSSFKMFVENKTDTEARIRVSDGVSIVFRSLRPTGTLLQNNVAYKYHVTHTHKDVDDREVMAQAQRLAAKAMNSMRKPTKRRKAA